MALVLLGEWVTALGTHANYGWVAYAPLSNSFNQLGGGLHPWVRLVVWLLLLVLWVSLSLVILRTPREPANSVRVEDS